MLINRLSSCQEYICHLHSPEKLMSAAHESLASLTSIEIKILGKFDGKT